MSVWRLVTAMLVRPLVVESMLQRGADPSMKDKFGQTPLQFAIEGMMPEKVRLLLLYHSSEVNLPSDLKYREYGTSADRIRVGKVAPLAWRAIESAEGV